MALKWLRDQFKHLKIVLWAVVGVFVLLVFVDWGAGRGGGPGGAEAAIRIGDRSVSEQEFLDELRRNQERFRQMYGDQWEQVQDQIDLAAQTVQQIVDREMLLQEAREVGITVSSDELQKEILSFPVFQRSDGSFVGADVYQRILRANRTTPEEFESDLRTDLMVRKLTDMMQQGVWVSDEEVAEEYRRTRETADFDVLFVRYEDMLPGIEVGEEQVRAYYDEHPEEFSRDEERVLRYLLVETGKLRRLLPVDDDDLRAYYDQHKEEFVEGEQAHAAHVLIRVPPGASEQQRLAAQAEAETVAEKAREGVPFAELAATYSEDPGSKDSGGDLGWFGRGRMVPEFEEAVFGAKPGDIVGPVKSQFGYHVIKVEGFQPERQKTFEEVRDDVRFRLLEGRAASEAESRAQALARRVREEKPTTDDEWQAIADSDEAVTFNVSPPFAADEPVPGTANDQELTAAAFDAEVGVVGGTQAVPRGWMVWEVKEVKPAGLAPFEDVRAQAEQAVRRATALGAAMDRAAKMAADWRGGAEVDQLRQSYDAVSAEAREHQRGQAVPRVGTAPNLDQAVFAAATGDVVGPVLVEGRGAAVARVDALDLVDDAQLAGELVEARRRVMAERGNRLLASIVDERRRETVISVDNELMERFAKRS